MFQVIPVNEAREKAIKNISQEMKNLTWKSVDFYSARGKVLAEDIISSTFLPPFTRSTVDGYAVIAEETYGATESVPTLLQNIGKIDMGKKSDRVLKKGETIEIYTGGALPKNADAVIMLEDVDKFDEETVAVNTSLAPGENVIWKGEDICPGDPVFYLGHRLRPQDIGALAGLGITRVKVYNAPKIGIISTGDELVPPEEEPGAGQIRDINSWALQASLENKHAESIFYGIVADEKAQFQAVVQKAVYQCDMVIISGGSSVGTRDLTAETLDRLGDPGVLFHGVSIKPGKPTIFAMLEGVPVFGLSGNPVSALVTFDLLVAPGIEILSGRTWEQLKKEQVPVTYARLTRNISSKGGREDYIRVKLYKNLDGVLMAEPVLGESGLIFTLTEADGLVCIPQNAEGIMAGEEVGVNLLR